MFLSELLAIPVVVAAGVVRALWWLVLPAGLLALASTKPQVGWDILLVFLAALVLPGLMERWVEADSLQAKQAPQPAPRRA